MKSNVVNNNKISLKIEYLIPIILVLVTLPLIILVVGIKISVVNEKTKAIQYSKNIKYDIENLLKDK